MNFWPVLDLLRLPLKNIDTSISVHDFSHCISSNAIHSIRIYEILCGFKKVTKNVQVRVSMKVTSSNLETA